MGTTRQINPRQIQHALNLMDQHIDMPNQVYKGDWDDEKIAKTVGVTVDVIQRFRTKHVVKMKPSPGMGDKGRLKRLEDRLGDLGDMIEKMVHVVMPGLQPAAALVRAAPKKTAPKKKPAKRKR